MPADLAPAKMFGHDAFRLSGGAVVAMVVPALGGRVLGLAVDGHDLFWHDPRLEGGPEALPGLPRPVFWGGWRTWVAPQSRWPERPGGGSGPAPDLDEGVYRADLDIDLLGGPLLRLTSPTCRETGLEIVREITIDARTSALSIAVTLTNRAAPGPLEAGIWEVIQLKKPTQVSFPVDRTHFKADRGVRAYESERDSLAALDAGHLRVLDDAAGRHAEVRCAGRLRFKFGARSPVGHGWIRAVMPERGRRAVKLRFDAPAGVAYAHEGASVEVYSSDQDYCEIEGHAPLATLAPGASTRAAFRLEVAGRRQGKPPVRKR